VNPSRKRHREEEDDDDDDEAETHSSEEDEYTEPLYRCRGVPKLGCPEHQTTFDKMVKQKQNKKTGCNTICLACRSVYNSDRRMHQSGIHLAKMIR
jgi:hypothetical protein